MTNTEDAMKQERIAEVGYINEAQQHALISIYNPPILNAGSVFVQVALTIQGATKLRDELDAFLASHYSGSTHVH